MGAIINAERAVSERSACPECARAWGADHARECVLRPVPRYEDFLREMKACRPEDYWGKYVEYFTP